MFNDSEKPDHMSNGKRARRSSDRNRAAGPDCDPAVITMSLIHLPDHACPIGAMML
jgi:hypothetical protein